MFDFLREKSNDKSSDQSSDRHADLPQPGKQTLAGVYGAVKTTFVVGPNDPLEVRAAHDLLESATNDRERLVALSRIADAVERSPAPIALRLLDLMDVYAKPYAQLKPALAERRDRVQHRQAAEATALAEKQAKQAREDAMVSVPHIVRPAYDASLVAPGSLESQIKQLDAQIAVGQWGDVARRLNWLPDKDLADYTYGPTNVKTLSFGKLAHIREAATKIGGFDRAVDAIDKADPNAKHIALQYWKYEQMVEYGRSSGKWGFAAEQLSKLGDWDIADRLGRLTRPERLHVRENTTDQRVIDAIDKLEGAPEDRLKALKAALAAERWGETAERMNGLGEPELAKYVESLTAGQRAHIYGSASAAMPGFAGRVKGAILAIDKGAAEVGERYTALETALASAKTGGSWSDVAKHINVMNTYDVTMYLKQLDDGQLAELERTPISAAVRTSIEKTRAGRLDVVRREYTRAITAGDWRSVARQLSQLPPSDIEHDVDAILARPDGKKDLARVRAAAGSVPDGYRTIEWIDRFHPDALPSVPPPVTHTIAVPDVSGDRRALAGLSLENFAGHDDIHAFVQAIATEEAKRLVGHDKHKRDEQHIAADTFEALREGFITTAAYEPRPTFGQYAMAWMYETREMHEATSTYEGGNPEQWFNKMYRVVDDAHVPPIDQPLVDFGGNSGWRKGGKTKVQVHPVVNAFLAALDQKYKSWTSTYDNHGSHVWEPFCVDVTPSFIEKDERGLYERGAAMQFLHTVDNILRGLGASWRAIYDDAEFADYANKEFGVVSHDTSKAGDTPVPVPTPNYNVDTPHVSMTGDQGSKNWHGGLNLHFHFYVIPNNGGGPH